LISSVDQDIRRRTPDAVARRFEQPPAPEPEPDDGMPPGMPDETLPTTVRWAMWGAYLARNVTVVGLIRAFSRLVRRPVVWVFMLYPKLYGFVVAVTGGRVDDAEYEQRMGECRACPGLVRDGSRLYCGPCECPHWFMAELHRKNRWKRHYCPEERHAATEYPRFVTISPAGCGQRAFKVPGGRANGSH